ncbi:hypothetical protein SAMN05216565_10954 [Litchfieldia salsa]|uniref:Uncharacterized protein n=3 Tax=Litchfieldia salsa TaxID=930152 RepID=A0A1H0W5R9_9BACI|nr:hypothetical protein SAMN05216565_10954 [Litchfieldia salsa]
MKLKLLVVIFSSLVVLSACAGENTNTSQEDQTQIIKDLVQDFSEGTIKDKSGSITSSELIVTDSEGSEQTYDLSETDFFVSIAPYEHQTHP